MEKEKFRVPPSGLKPQATAIPSSKVDFPLPFSPTKKVTGVSKRRTPPLHQIPHRRQSAQIALLRQLPPAGG